MSLNEVNPMTARKIGLNHRSVTGIVQSRNGMAAESREDTTAGRRVTIRDELAEARSRREIEPLAGPPADDRCEERHLAFAVDRRDDRQRLDAEPVERAATGRRLTGRGNATNARRISAVRRVNRQKHAEHGGGREAGAMHAVRL